MVVRSAWADHGYNWNTLPGKGAKYMVLCEIIVRCTGGFWRYRERIVHANNTFLRSMMFFIYYLYLEEKMSFIGINASFKGAPQFPHGIKCVMISNSSVIGKDCIIFHQVTIGSNTIKTSKKYGAPVIGDNVLIGAGATIIGGINIGNNVRIGANCCVFDDIPDNSVVVSEKPRILQKNSVNNTDFDASALFPSTHS